MTTRVPVVATGETVRASPTLSKEAHWWSLFSSEWIDGSELKYHVVLVITRVELCPLSEALQPG